MTTAYNWNISQIDCYPTAEGQTDVAFNVHWQCTGTQVGLQTYTGSVYSTCGVNYVAGTPFTPYADLTQDQVLGWIWASGVDQAATEAAVEAQIQNQINPPVVSPPLPWSV